MPDARIRRAAAADLPVLTRLWQTAFGDPPELIGAFYHRFPPEIMSCTAAATARRCAPVGEKGSVR